MKRSLPAIVIAFFLLSGYHSYAQLLQTHNDARKLKDNDSLFIGKPLKTLLKEIGPTIKTVFTESHRAHKSLSIIIF